MCGPWAEPFRQVSSDGSRLTLSVLNSRQLESVGGELSVVFRIFFPKTKGLKRLFRWLLQTAAWISSFVSTFS